MDAPATLPPFSSRTSPCTVAVVICACPHPDVAQARANTSTKKAHQHFFIFPPKAPSPVPANTTPRWSGNARGNDGESVGQFRSKQQVQAVETLERRRRGASRA